MQYQPSQYVKAYLVHVMIDIRSYAVFITH